MTVLGQWYKENNMPTIINGLTGIDKIQSGAIDVNDIPNGVITLAKLTPSGTNGQVLTSSGIGSAPVWAAVSGGLGDGQTWQTVTGSRASGTTYSNSTGKPIMVSVKMPHAATGTMSVVVGGVTLASARTSGQFVDLAYTFIVPNDTNYSVTFNVAGWTWVELR
jgi:hypothetical protein